MPHGLSQYRNGARIHEIVYTYAPVRAVPGLLEGGHVLYYFLHFWTRQRRADHDRRSVLASVRVFCLCVGIQLHVRNALARCEHTQAYNHKCTCKHITISAYRINRYQRTGKP